MSSESATKDGEVTNPGAGAGAGEGGEEFIAGTPFKTVDELAKGYSNLKTLSDTQGNELGTLRKSHDGLKTQTETLMSLLKEVKGQPAKVETPVTKPDYDTEIAAIETQIKGLDPLAPDYQANLSTLLGKSTRLATKAAEDRALSAAGELFKQELTERDIKSAQAQFFQNNQDFNTPDMQARIQDSITKDKTGMTDALSAYREIQRDDALARLQAAELENAEYKRLIDLNKGREEAGKVVVKTQTTPQPPTPPQKAVGKDLDAGMMAALKASRGE